MQERKRDERERGLEESEEKNKRGRDTEGENNGL